MNILILSVLTTAACPEVARGSFVAAPMELHLKAAPGETERRTLTITNTGQDSLTLKIYLGDSRLYPDGKEEELRAGGHLRSCADWVLLQDQILELAAGESRRSGVSIQVPPDADGSYWSKVYIEEISTPRAQIRQIEGRSYSVFMKQRIGIRLFEDVAGTGSLEACVSNVVIKESPGGVPRILVTVENAGTLIARCIGRVELRDTAGAVVETLRLGSEATGFWVYPGSRREFSVLAEKAFGLGTYTALAIVDFGAEHLIAGDAVFRVTEEGVRGGYPPLE